MGTGTVLEFPVKEKEIEETKQAWKVVLESAYTLANSRMSDLQSKAKNTGLEEIETDELEELHNLLIF